MAKEPDTTTPAPLAPKVPHPVLDLVDTWFQETRQNFAHLDSETHNQLYRAAEALKAKLAALFA